MRCCFVLLSRQCQHLFCRHERHGRYGLAPPGPDGPLWELGESCSSADGHSPRPDFPVCITYAKHAAWNEPRCGNCTICSCWQHNGGSMLINGAYSANFCRVLLFAEGCSLVNPRFMAVPGYGPASTQSARASAAGSSAPCACTCSCAGASSSSGWYRV